MGLLDKLMFWKKGPDFGDMGDMGDFGKGMPESPELALPGEERLGLPEDTGMQGDFGAQGGPVHHGAGESARTEHMPGAGPMGPSATFAAPRLEPVQQRQAPQENYYGTPSGGNRDMELVSVKIDQIRTSLDILNQRMANIEQMLQSQRPRW